jgi:hypothetical protein
MWIPDIKLVSKYGKGFRMKHRKLAMITSLTL